MKHSTYSASPWFPLELNCSNEEQNSVPFSWISDNRVFSQLSTNFLPSACLHEIKGGIFSARSRLTEWDELHLHTVTVVGVSLIYLIMGTNFPWQMMFSILWFFYVSWAVRSNVVKTASAWLSACQHRLPRCCSQDTREILAEDKTAELKSFSEESKCLRHLLAKSGQLGRAHSRSSRRNESCQDPFKVSKFCGI